MTSDQQFYLQLATIIAGLIALYLRADKAAVQSTAAKEVAEQGVAVAINNSKKSDEANSRLIEIHTLTNSNLSDAVKRLDVAMEKISGLEKMVSTMTDAKMVADKTAESLANKVAAAPPPRPARATDLQPAEPTKVEIVSTEVTLPVEIVESAEKPKKRGDVS